MVKQGPHPCVLIELWVLANIVYGRMCSDWLITIVRLRAKLCTGKMSLRVKLVAAVPRWTSVNMGMTTLVSFHIFFLSLLFTLLNVRFTPSDLQLNCSWVRCLWGSNRLWTRTLDRYTRLSSLNVWSVQCQDSQSVSGIEPGLMGWKTGTLPTHATEIVLSYSPYRGEHNRSVYRGCLTPTSHKFNSVQANH